MLNRFGRRITRVRLLEKRSSFYLGPGREHFFYRFNSTKNITDACKVETPDRTMTESDLLPRENIYADNLKRYYENTCFKFRKDSDLQNLKDSIECLYLRKRPAMCIDVEAWERNISKVTEVGVAIYDPKDSPYSIFPVIKQFHIIIKEHEKMVNGRFCPDNKRKFMGGTSYKMSMSECRSFMNKLISQYWGRDDVPDAVLVGHNVKADINWLRSVGSRLPEPLSIVDTSKLHSMSFTSGGSLRNILRLLQIPHGYLHNAANDAYYTLLAAFAYCDPETRTKLSLDTFHADVPLKQTKSEKLQKRKRMLSDNADLVVWSDSLASKNDSTSTKHSPI
ncbi:Piso0_002408 [Millerozyma farinosa CBS 7064]|uniref:Piso0_002408 protein n=1 Tax=Pichia sorbitophila (strain ATCC MYA-4447 / BCRC 22081 / CBS 7064 / NBRC 10061 / NRRL Y-12695) TaxID=559304 RepID=G8YCJ1_PICSO|nr:Piso0_002408 [Millerozyma farinosa CBS 7064]